MTAAKRGRVAWSPFLAMPAGWRTLVIAYFVLYQWLFPAVAAGSSSDAQPLLIPRVLMHLGYVLLVCLPLIFYRREYGFLHPLVLPVLFSTVKQIGEVPLSLVAPFSFPAFSFNVSTTSQAVSLATLSHTQLAWTRLGYDGVRSLALVALYAGYFIVRRLKVPHDGVQQPRHVGEVCFAATMACVTVAALFIVLFGGGVSALIVAQRTGRHALFSGQGQYLQIARFSLVPVLVWFVYRRRPLLSPWWVAALVAASLASLITTGSRSSVILPLAILMVLWWRKAGRVLIAPGIAVAVLAIALIGAFGSIRGAYGSQSVDTSVLNIHSLGDNIAKAKKEFQLRNDQEADLAAFAGARAERLDGRSYLGAVAFLVPRRIWSDKPQSADAYNMAVNFAGRTIANYRSGPVWGIPVTATSEAYWNFGVPGVIGVFLLLGLALRWASDLVWRNPASPAMLIVAVWIALNFNGTSLSFVHTARDLMMIAVLYVGLGIWRPTFALGPTRSRLARPTTQPALASAV